MRVPRDKSDRRAALAAGLIMVWACLIIGRLVELQVLKHDEFTRLARGQQQHTIVIPALRGEILARDSFPLAISVRTESAVINPLRVVDPDFFGRVTAPVLGLDAGKLAASIREKQSSRGASRRFLRLKRHLSAGERDRLRLLQRTFPIEILPDARRDYPSALTAAHVIGALDAEGNGNAGLEQKLNRELKGKPGALVALTGSRQDQFLAWVKEDGVQGVNLTLAIDRVIQYDAERHLADGIRDASASSGTVVVMDPSNGEILALANYPTFDPRREKPTAGEAEARHSNIAVQIPCEPGSVMKMITVTMGIDTGTVQPDSVIYCENGAFPRPGRKAIHDVHRYGALDVAHILIKSSNIGVAKISLAAGPSRLYEYLKKFAIGDKTGIELPAESRGILRRQACQDSRDANCWSASSHEYIAFGHEVSATAVQLARATAVIANGGLLVQPHLVIGKSRPTPDGGEIAVPLEIQPRRRVLRAETAFTIRRMMENVVVEGTGRAAAIPGYSAGGKTGSAQIFEEGRWQNRHNSSFIGFAPVTNPRIVIVVTLNRTPRLGGAAAAPVFRKVAETALRVLQVPMDRPETFHSPVPSRPRAVPAPEAIAAVTGPVSTPALVGPRVPDFRGKPLASVLQESAALGLPVETLGRGQARMQSPPPGTLLAPGMRVQVRFAVAP